MLLIPHMVFVATLMPVLPIASADIFVVDRETGEKIKFLKSVSAGFGQSIPEDGISGMVMMGNPVNGCLPMKAPVFKGTADLVPVALIARYGGCNFQQKIQHATLANYSAAIVYNVDSDKLVPMGGDDDSLIPSVFIGNSAAKLLIENYLYPDTEDYEIFISGSSPFDINSYLLPFAIVIGICFLIMLSIVLFKCYQDYRRSRRHRLPKSALKKLPVIKFKTGDPYETCCICLDDYVEGEKLRILPCDHGYHSKCIDPWLVKNKRICPQCRMRVFASDHSDSETEDESAPLVRRPPNSNSRRNSSRSSRSQQPSTSRGGGTFAAANASHLRRPGGPMSALERADFGRNLRRHLNLYDDDDGAGPSGISPATVSTTAATTASSVPRTRLLSSASSHTSMESESGTTTAVAVVQPPQRGSISTAVVHKVSVEAVPSVQVNVASPAVDQDEVVSDNLHEEV